MEEYFKLINKYLDEGWKMTAISCEEPKCTVGATHQGSLLANLQTSKTFCPRCKTSSDAEFEVKKSPLYDAVDRDPVDDEDQAEPQDPDFDQLASSLLSSRFVEQHSNPGPPNLKSRTSTT